MKSFLGSSTGSDVSLYTTLLNFAGQLFGKKESVLASEPRPCIFGKSIPIYIWISNLHITVLIGFLLITSP